MFCFNGQVFHYLSDSPDEPPHKGLWLLNEYVVDGEGSKKTDFTSESSNVYLRWKYYAKQSTMESNRDDAYNPRLWTILGFCPPQNPLPNSISHIVVPPLSATPRGK
ncbi:hypothetical protein GGP41_010175 [Bipolaris sorokiniana]|uniref:Uncharacterized protein n=1 Tax=Cochliobolus sativus TaxID=45130 RepID=A0A8H5Z7A4_COCSA|nr:hypothetical protein GGP41_010175 [Bipolaris sorokiniana]